MTQTTESHAFARKKFEIPPEALPRAEDFVTEDDTPADCLFSEKQQRLLTGTLYTSWKPGKPFAAMSNVGLFFSVKQPPLVPDMMLSLNVEMPENIWKKSNRSYFIWEYGKPPEATVEIVTDKEGDELGGKLETYAQIGVRYYVVHDPQCLLSKMPLRVFKLTDTDYVESSEHWLPKIGLGLTLWEGEYERLKNTWLRWCNRNKALIPTDMDLVETAEHRLAEAKRQRIEAERRRAKAEQFEAERQRAKTAEQRMERLVAQLRALGISPDEGR
ncbi:MAG: Uma2 family endonuclease [Gammaproteobacteria bacterium]|nr:Uma2 family endonuclease [Gammaproteobacteria bacterium]